MVTRRGAFILLTVPLGAALAAPPAGGIGDGPFRYDRESRPSRNSEKYQPLIAASIDGYRQSQRKSAVRSQTSAPAAYAFIPVGATFYDDLHPTNFVDLDGGPGERDYSCHNPPITYDGHDGIDLAVRSFAAQDIGVPIFAAADGVVVEAHDGEFDRSTERTDKPVNFVVLDHGGDRYAYYLHMKRGSVAVSAGDEVRAGQQIGLVGSSGFSDAPHLHFSSYNGFAVYEPFSGACRSGASGWVAQPGLDVALKVWDIGVTPLDIGSAAEWPEPMPVGGQLGVEDSRIYVWVQLQSLPENSTHRLRFERPDGTIAYEYGPVAFDPAEFYPTSWWWWWFDVADLHTVTGTWHVLVEVNGATVARAPFSVLSSRSSAVNHAPAAVTVSFDPPAPGPSDVLFCRVNTSPILDDPDFDFVRYEYVWTVAGAEVRRVTSGGHADALPLGTLVGGENVVCSATPSDGAAFGPSASAQFVVAEEAIVDNAIEDDPDVTPDNTNDNTAVGDDNDNDNAANENGNVEDDAAVENGNDNTPAADDVADSSDDPEVTSGVEPPSGGGSRACGVGFIPLLMVGWTLVLSRRSRLRTIEAPTVDGVR